MDRHVAALLAMTDGGEGEGAGFRRNAHALRYGLNHSLALAATGIRSGALGTTLRRAGRRPCPTFSEAVDF